MLYLDTHAAVYLYMGDLTLFGPKGKKLLKTEPLIISPIVLLELEYLYEISRINSSSSKIYAALKKDCDLEICQTSFSDVITCAKTLIWTRDPFDRIIAAQALVNKGNLLTKDQTITTHYDLARW
jgi:PIN domain nuclease of toxin-antitoxin system